MKRWAWAVAACCLALFAGAVWHHVSFREDAPTSRITVRQAERRYYQCEPRHWRNLMLQH